MKRKDQKKFVTLFAGVATACAAFAIANYSQPTVQTSAATDTTKTFWMEDGASVRKTQGASGIRWKSHVSEAWWTEQNVAADTTVTFYTQVTEATNTSFENTAEAPVKTIVSASEKAGEIEFQDGVFTFGGAITYNDLTTEAERLAAYKAELTARSYVVIGENEPIYAEVGDVARSIRSVALAAKENTEVYDTYLPEEKEVINGYFGTGGADIAYDGAYYQSSEGTGALANSAYTVAYANAKKVGTVSGTTLILDPTAVELGKDYTLTLFDDNGNYAKTSSFKYITKTIDDYADWTSISDDLTGYYELTADIDGNGANAPQIGGYDTNTSRPSFTGTVNGNGYTFKNVGIDVDPWYHNGGLFDRTEGVIENLNLEINAPTGTLKSFGLLVNQNYGTIRNCKIKVEMTTGSINNAQSVGAIARANSTDGLIENCIVVATGSIGTGEYFNALIGDNAGTTKNLYAVSPFNANGSGTISATCGVYASEAEMAAAVDLSDFANAVWGKPAGRAPVLLNASRGNVIVLDSSIALNTHPDKGVGQFALTVYDRDYNVITDGLSMASSATDVATVENGTVQAVGDGTATVTVTKGEDSVEVPVTSEYWNEISDLEDWWLMNTSTSAKFYLANDVDGAGATPIQYITTFSGTLDGRGYSVKNLTIAKLDEGGLFKKLEAGGVIENLDVAVTGANWRKAAGLVFNNYGTVRNCKVTLTLNRDSTSVGSGLNASNAAPIVAYNQKGGLIENCIADLKGSDYQESVYSAVLGWNRTGATMKNVFSLASYTVGGVAPSSYVAVGAFESTNASNAATNYGVYKTATDLWTDVNAKTVSLADFDPSIWTIVEGELPALTRKAA